MDLETTIATLEDAGFIVDAVYPDVIVSLDCRAVNTMEVAFVLDIEPDQCYRNGDSVMIYFGED